MSKAKAPRVSKPEKKALKAVERARAAYTRTETHVGDLRLSLDRSEKKLARRTDRLAAAEAALAALVTPASAPEPSSGAAPADAGTSAPAASANGAIEKPAASANGATASTRTRSRRKAAAPSDA